MSARGRILISQGETVIADVCVEKAGSSEPPAPVEMNLAHLRARFGLGEMLGMLISTKGTVAGLSSERTRCVTIEGTDAARANVLLMETDYYPTLGDRISVKGLSVEGYNGVPSILALTIRSV